jgi:predicted secreted hydrolase
MGRLRLFLLGASLLSAGLLHAPPETGGWRQAEPGYRFRFPSDHASHPEYKIEWWYYTGNVAAANGRRFGYQLTFFRMGLDYEPVNPSRWAVRDLFMAHMAVSDIAGGRFHFAELLNRAGPGWAGAETSAYRVWNQGWEARLDSGGSHVLRASEGGIGLDLVLEPGGAPVPQGEAGYSRKGVEAGNASEYYSLTRMPTRGLLRVDGAEFEVSGASWMDHEFGTSFLEPAQVGWDWFSLQLDDGRDLMLFQLRRSDGARDPHSSGTLVEGPRIVAPLAAPDFELVPDRKWKSSASGAEYPLEWSVRVPKRQLDLRVRAAIDDQELRTPQSTGVSYYEGAVVVTDATGRPCGRGYLEMTGYAGAPISERFR